MVRLMREGARGGWVNGSLTWSGLDSWQIQSGEYRPDHLTLVRELYAVHRAREGRAAYYSYGAEKTLDLSDCDSAQLWSLLDEAARLGLKLVHAQPGLGEVRCHRRGELLIDVTRQDDQGSLLTAVLRVDGDDADGLEPLLFLGSSGHGVVCAERGDDDDRDDPESRRLRLVRLASPRRRRCSGCCSTRAAADPGERDASASPTRSVPRCATSPRWSPRTDPSPRPRSPHPTLVLRASYGADHAVEVGWEWVYQVGATHAARGACRQRSQPRVSRPRRRARDPRGRRLHRDRPRALRPARRRGRPAEAHAASLTGLDSMRLTTEVLPRLAERPDVTVEVVGEPADYRDVGDSLTIGVSTVEHRRRARLVRPRRDDQRRRARAAVRRGVHGARERRVAHAARDGAHFSLLDARPAVAAAADRRGPRARRLAVGAAADQPLSGRAVGRARRARRRHRAGAGVAAPGRRAARARRDRRARAAGDAAGASCAPTSARASAGWRRCGSSSSAGSSPTTWASARRCRRSR